MSLQTLSQIILAIGIILTAFGGFGSYHFGKEEEKDKERVSEEAQRKLTDQIVDLKSELESVRSKTSQIDEKVDLIFKASGFVKEKWTEIPLKHVPEGVADYVVLLFASDKGRVSGKVRIKYSRDEYPFSTTANNRIPVAVRNLWLPEKGHYKVPTVLEFLVSEKTEVDASLSIYTQGWIDTRGREPH